MRTYEFGPLCLLYPQMSDDELKQLAERIRENGWSPLSRILVADGRIEDGRNRQLAVERYGEQFGIDIPDDAYLEYDPQTMPPLLDVVADANFRREGIADQRRYVIYRKIKAHLTQEAEQKKQEAGGKHAGGRPKKGEKLVPNSVPVSESRIQARAARFAGISNGSASQLDKLYKYNVEFSDRDLVTKVELGVLSLNKAYTDLNAAIEQRAKETGVPPSPPKKRGGGGKGRGKQETPARPAPPPPPTEPEPKRQQTALTILPPPTLVLGPDEDDDDDDDSPIDFSANSVKEAEWLPLLLDYYDTIDTLVRDMDMGGKWNEALFLSMVSKQRGFVDESRGILASARNLLRLAAWIRTDPRARAQRNEVENEECTTGRPSPKPAPPVTDRDTLIERLAEEHRLTPQSVEDMRNAPECREEYQIRNYADQLEAQEWTVEYLKQIDAIVQQTRHIRRSQSQRADRIRSSAVMVSIRDVLDNMLMDMRRVLHLAADQEWVRRHEWAAPYYEEYKERPAHSHEKRIPQAEFEALMSRVAEGES